MDGYAKGVEKVQRTLCDFKQKGTIDGAKLDPLDQLIRSSETDQLRILNTPRLSLDQQRAMFGAMRNICNTTKMMKRKLMAASQRHENPTTADLSLEMIQSLLNLAPYVDAYVIRGRVDDVKIINEFSRILHKKAKYLGFSEDVATQLKEINITTSEVRNFIERLNQNIDHETDTDEDAGPMDEGTR